MNIQPGNPALSIAVYFYLGSVSPDATSDQKAFPRERFSVAWCAILSIMPTAIITSVFIGAVSQVQRKMAVLKIAVERRYNKGWHKHQLRWLDALQPAAFGRLCTQRYKP